MKAAKLKAGKIRHRLTIQQNQPAANSFNEPTENWQTFKIRFASIEPFTGREAWTAQQVQPDVTHRIKMRFTPGVTPKMRGVFQGRVFNFLTVHNIEERNRELEILAKEQV